MQCLRVAMKTTTGFLIAAVLFAPASFLNAVIAILYSAPPREDVLLMRLHSLASVLCALVALGFYIRWAREKGETDRLITN